MPPAIMSLPDHIPAITGEPVIDSPKILDWPVDNVHLEPCLTEPTANLVHDLHASINHCEMVLSTAGNYHMALKEIWDMYLSKFPPDDPLRNWYYTTSPPVIKKQIANNLVQFGNVTARCRPQIAVGPQGLIDSLAHQGLTVGDALPLSKTRGNVLLVKKGNPKRISTIWDLSRSSLSIITPNPRLETGSFMLYARSIYDIAKYDKNPPTATTATDFFNIIFNDTGKEPARWLSGKRIHHRETPWSIAYGKADIAVIFYHLALHAAKTFPDLFEIVSLGGTPAYPKPMRGNHVEILHAVRINGTWTKRQHIATEKLMDLFQSGECTSILDKHGLDRP